MSHTLRLTSFEICQLIEDHYYRRDSAETQEFIAECFERARDERPVFSRARQLRRLNARLSALGTSHLHLFTPEENREAWANTSDTDNGLRVRLIESSWVVFAVIAGSAADEAGFRIGDVVESIDGEAPSTASEIQIASGSFRSRRGAQPRVTVMKARELEDDLSMRVSALDHDVGLLKISSFLPTYMSDEELARVRSEIAPYRALVVDVRENAGGSFPAALRVASLFHCRAITIGEIWRPPSRATPLRERSLALDDNLSPESQLKALKEAEHVRLTTWPKYGCFAKPVIVLIDSETTSVAEIFAASFSLREHSQIWGQPSAGQVVMAQWFPVKSLGGGDFALSIPIAGYRTVDGEELENQDVQPSRALEYDLERAQLGRDSWIEDAARAVSN